MKKKKWKVFRFFCSLSCLYRDSVHPKQQEWPQAPSSEPQSFDLCLWASVLYLHVFCALISKTCPKVSEEPERTCKDVLLSVELGISQRFDHGEWNNDIVRGEFWVWECLKLTPYKLMAIVSLLYTMLAYERFHRNTLLLGSGGNLCFILQTRTSCLPI